MVPSGLVCRESCPNQMEPSATDSCTTTPERSLRMSEMSRRVRRLALMVSNWPTETAAKAVYSASVPKIHG
jgi:hypothetical protein